MERAEEMRELFARWKSSGGSLMAFGKREGVAYSRLMYWRRKLDGGVVRKRAPRAKSDAPELVPVRIVPDSKLADSRMEPFEVWLSNGVSLNVSAGFDEGELRRLVGVLSGC